MVNIWIPRSTFQKHLAQAIYSCCLLFQFMRMRYTLCYVEREERVWDTRTKSGKATAITFYAVSLAYSLDPVCRERPECGSHGCSILGRSRPHPPRCNQRTYESWSACAHCCSHHLNWWPFPSPYSNEESNTNMDILKCVWNILNFDTDLQWHTMPWTYPMSRYVRGRKFIIEACEARFRLHLRPGMERDKFPEIHSHEYLPTIRWYLASVPGFAKWQNRVAATALFQLHDQGNSIRPCKTTSLPFVLKNGTESRHGGGKRGRLI